MVLRPESPAVHRSGGFCVCTKTTDAYPRGPAPWGQTFFRVRQQIAVTSRKPPNAKPRLAGSGITVLPLKITSVRRKQGTDEERVVYPMVA